jgi:hypothetical protein
MAVAQEGVCGELKDLWIGEGEIRVFKDGWADSGRGLPFFGLSVNGAIAPDWF